MSHTDSTDTTKTIHEQNRHHMDSSNKRSRKLKLDLEYKLLFTMDEAAALLNISRSKMDKLVLRIDPLTKKPFLPTVMNGRFRLVPKKSLDQLIEQIINEDMRILNESQKRRKK